MKGIVLAGGRATRLRPLTWVISKQLLPVYNKPMIFYPIETLIRAGIKDILIILAPENSGLFLNLLGTGEEFGVRFSYAVQKEPRGLAEAFIIGEDFLDNDDVTMVLGDNIIDEDFSQQIKNFKSGGQIYVKKLDNIEEVKRLGVVELDENNKVLSIEEKPEQPKSMYVSVGLYTYDRHVVEIAKNLNPSARGELEISGENSVNNTYLEKGQLKACVFDSYWQDAGTFNSLLDAGNHMAQKAKKENGGRKLLVTGGAGFIGSNFIRYWLNKYPSDEIINLDSLTYAGHLESLKDIVQNPNYSFVKGDINDAVLVDSLVSKVDIIVHFAAETHVDRSIEDPTIFTKTNVMGTQVLLEAAKKYGTRFHHISTDEVFGALDLHSKNKFNSRTKYDPNSPYAASKAASDHLVMSYHTTFGLPVTITNCSNNFGPYQDTEKFIPRAVTDLIDGQNIKIYGDGKYVRDWLYVEDHCRAIELVLLKGKTGHSYTVGGMKKDVSNLQLAKKILKIMDLPETRIEYIKDRPGHDRRYAVSWKKINKELGWEPEMGFYDRLKQTVEWYRNNEWWWRDLKKISEEFYKKK